MGIFSFPPSSRKTKRVACVINHHQSSKPKTQHKKMSVSVCVVTAGFCARSKHQNSKAVSFAHPNKTRIDHPPVCPRSSTKEKGWWNLRERSKERSLFQSGFSLLLLWRFPQIQSPSPFSPMCACCLSELLEGKTRRRKKAEMCHRPWLQVPISRRVDPAEEEQKGRFQNRKEKNKTGNNRTHVSLRFGCGRWMVQKVRPEKRRVFSCLLSSIFN
jgi:hypothetical protein